MDELETAYVSLFRAGTQPSEIWNMTWPEYMVLMVAAREDEASVPSDVVDSERGNVIHCESFEDFATVLAGTRGRIE